MKRDFFCTAAVLLAASACSNVSDEAVSLAGFRLQDNKGTEEEYIFPAGASIAAHGYLVLEKDAAFEFGISGDGDEIKLLDASYRPVDEVVVPALEDGQTYARTSNGGAQWTIVEGGTKGRDNTTAPDEQPEIEESNLGLFINEVFTNNQDEQVSAGWDDTKDFIELYNASDKDIDLSGFSLNDEDLDEDKKYVYRTSVEVVDTEDPKIFGSSSRTVLVGYDGNLCNGITYGDNYDGQPECRIEGDIDFETAGKYDVELVVTDVSGNSTNYNVTVNVVEEIKSNKKVETSSRLGLLEQAVKLKPSALDRKIEDVKHVGVEKESYLHQVGLNFKYNLENN